MILERGPASPGPTSPLPQGWVTGACCHAFVWVIWTQVLALAQSMLYSASHFLFFFNVLCRACLLFGYGTQHSVALVESVWCTVFWSLLPSNDRLRHTPQAVLSGLVQIYSVTFAQGQKSPSDATLSTKPSHWLHVADRGARMMPLPLALTDSPSESVTGKIIRCYQSPSISVTDPWDS